MANKVVAALDSGPNCERLRALVDQLPEDVGSAWHTFCDAQLRRINELNRVSRRAGTGSRCCGVRVW